MKKKTTFKLSIHRGRMIALSVAASRNEAKSLVHYAYSRTRKYGNEFHVWSRLVLRATVWVTGIVRLPNRSFVDEPSPSKHGRSRARA